MKFNWKEFINGMFWGLLTGMIAICAAVGAITISVIFILSLKP